MRRCPVAAWEGWTTKCDVLRTPKGPPRETVGGPILYSCRASQSKRILQRVEIRLLGEFPGLSRNGRATGTRESP